MLGKQKNLSLFRAFCVNETTESTNITGKTSYEFHSRGPRTQSLSVTDHAAAAKGEEGGVKVHIF